LPGSLRSQIAVGIRVAVPFAGRKISAIVLERHQRRPEIPKLKDVAQVLDSAPIFSPELLAFLLQAADYYFAPIGEVLRAASPALTSDDLRDLRASGFLEASEKISSKHVAIRREMFVSKTGKEPEKRLGAKQREVLERLNAGELSLAELRRHAKSARTI